MTQPKLLITSLIITLLTSTLSNGQTVVIETESTIGSGFRSDIGIITAAHVIGDHASIRYDDIDLAVIKTDNKGDKHPLGTGEPNFFYDRRMNTNQVAVIEEEANQWIVNQEFYPGESGLPVFNNTGQVCGVVLGNAKIGGKWLGRVGILQRLRDRISSRESTIQHEIDPTPKPRLKLRQRLRSRFSR